MFDLKITGGTIVDGTGRPTFVGDVAVKDGRIAEVGPSIEGDATETIDATGLVTTFGFGTHFCLGAHLARAELQTALQVILSRLPDLRLRTTDGVRITGTIHHLLRGPTALPVAFGSR